MVIKVNYNIVAVLLSVILVATFCLLELAGPKEIRADVMAQTEESIQLPVAMYHHISTDPKWLGDYVISPEQLEEDLKYIQKCGYTTVSVRELLNYVEDGTPLPEKPVMITFDDGNESVYVYALPLLKKYNMKAVISILGNQTDFYSDPDVPSDVSYAYLNWDELRKMQASGIFEIGNHTYDMHENGKNQRYGIRIKRGESEDEYRKAIMGDVGMLNDKMEQELGFRPVVFAYPFGALCKESRPLLADIGFRVVLTCDERVNTITRGEEEPIVLKRFNRPHRYSTYEYYKKLGIVAGS